MRLLRASIQIVVVLVIATKIIMADEFIVEGNSTLRCTRENDRVTCQATYQYDVGTLCDNGDTSDVIQQPLVAPHDCYEVFRSGSTLDGVYTISPIGWTEDPFEVHCKMSHGGGWTVFQRRQDGSEEFYRSWQDYKDGFGTLSAEHWLGNEKLFYLTNQGNYEMRIDLVNKDGEPYHLRYEIFRISNETDEYKLSILGEYSGNIGYDYMEYHSDREFSTFDRGNSCPSGARGGWWYGSCFDANLNGDYSSSTSSGVCLYQHYNAGKYTEYSLRYTEMKVRPV